MAASVKRLRAEQRLTLDQLGKRLAEVGRPILASGLSKIEQGDRAVDVDDLVALALALEVNPNVLLMPAQADATKTEVTEDVTASTRQAWHWVAGESPLARWLPDGTLGGYRDERGVYHGLSSLSRWYELTNPHKSDDERLAEVQAMFRPTPAERKKAATRKASDGER